MNTIGVCAVLLLLCQTGRVSTQGKACFNKMQEKPGKCVSLKSCPSALKAVKRGEHPQNCGFDGLLPIICCTDDDRPVGKKSHQRCRTYSETYAKLKSKCNYPDSRTDLHFNGHNAYPGEFPHMVALGYSLPNGTIVFFCAGTLISEKFVLTAAFCTHLRDYENPVKVRLGDVSLQSTTSDPHSLTLDILKIIKHPNYNPPYVYDDLALLELKTPVVFTEYVFPACLNTKAHYHKNTIAVSWGENVPGEEKVMVKTALDVHTQRKCSGFFEQYDHILNEGVLMGKQLCAGPQNASRYLCKVTNDDSGGPLVSLSEELCVYKLIGVTAIGDACILERRPRIYSRISHYIAWIEDVVWP